MGTRRHWTCALTLAAVMGFGSVAAVSAARKDTEADLLARISRESNLIKKAKLEIRLARVKLMQAKNAREEGDIESSLQLLEAYAARVRSAWETLQQSGRPAHKKPQGFKELDIALREDERYLEDLQRSISVLQREPVEKISSDMSKIRAEVLKALFPALVPASP